LTGRAHIRVICHGSAANTLISVIDVAIGGCERMPEIFAFVARGSATRFAILGSTIASARNEAQITQPRDLHQLEHF